MSPPSEEPTKDQLLAMAYADGELSADESAAFQQRLASEPVLGREVASYQALALVARTQAPAEPADHEWARLELDPLQRSGLSAGWALFVVGIIGLAGYSVFAILQDDSITRTPKLLLIAGVTGTALLLLLTLRERLAVLPYDPYEKVER